MPFDSKGPIKKKSLKFDNQNSTVPVPKLSQAAIFEEQAKKAYSTSEEFKQRSLDLTSKFKLMIEDKILPDLKSPLTKGIESETMSKLLAFAIDLNEDVNEREGMGSSVLAFLALKMLLVQRDTINILQYKVDKLERGSLKLEHELKALSDPKKDK